jgi:hypothetical protein
MIAHATFPSMKKYWSLVQGVGLGIAGLVVSILG